MRCSGGCAVVQWWLCGGAVVQWWLCGGAVVQWWLCHALQWREPGAWQSMQGLHRKSALLHCIYYLLLFCYCFNIYYLLLFILPLQKKGGRRRVPQPGAPACGLAAVVAHGCRCVCACVRVRVCVCVCARVYVCVCACGFWGAAPCSTVQLPCVV